MHHETLDQASAAALDPTLDGWERACFAAEAIAIALEQAGLTTEPSETVLWYETAYSRRWWRRAEPMVWIHGWTARAEEPAIQWWLRPEQAVAFARAVVELDHPEPGELHLIWLRL